MKKIRTWQLCRTGKFGADGATITEQDLREIQETFTPPRPVTVGHDGAMGDRFPKFGDVLYIDGIYPDPAHPGEKVLVGNVVLHPELEKVFSDQADGGLYNGWSVTIPRRASDGKRYLHSLAICGAVPPKIPELEQLMVQSSYSDGDTVESVSYSDSVTYQEVAHCLDKSISKIEAAILSALEQTPPELYADIVENGIYLAGVGAMLRGLDKRLREKMNIQFHIAEDPLHAVAKGTGIALKNIDKFNFLIR